MSQKTSVKPLDSCRFTFDLFNALKHHNFFSAGQNLSYFIKNIFICVLKTSGSPMGLERHDGE